MVVKRYLWIGEDGRGAVTEQWPCGCVRVGEWGSCLVRDEHLSQGERNPTTAHYWGTFSLPLSLSLTHTNSKPGQGLGDPRWGGLSGWRWVRRAIQLLEGWGLGEVGACEDKSGSVLFPINVYNREGRVNREGVELNEPTSHMIFLRVRA